MPRPSAPSLAGALVLVLALAPAAHAARSTVPDRSGWDWADSREPGIDTSVETMPSPTTITLNFADEDIRVVDLSFPVRLYGRTSSRVWLTSNGWLTLSDPLGVTEPFNVRIPQATLPNALLAYYWDDLSGGNAEHGATANGHRIRVRHFDKASGDPVDVDIQFYRNGSIKVVWSRIPFSSGATIGIENDGGTFGTLLRFEGTDYGGFDLRDGYAVVFAPAARPACSGAAPASCGGSVNGSAGLALATAYGCAGGTWAGSETVYRVTLTAPQSLSLSLNSNRDQAVFVLRQGCQGYFDCVAGGAKDVTAPLLGAGVYYVVVDGVDAGDDGSFTLTAGCTPQSIALACGGSRTGSPAGPSRIDGYGCTAGSYGGPEILYDFTLASTQTVTASLTPAAPFDLVLVDQATLAPVTSPCTSAGDVVGGLNLPPGAYAVVVDGATGSSGSTNVTLACQPQVPAVPIACGQVDVPGNNSGPSFADRYDCAGLSYPRGEAYYRLRPPTPSVVTITTADAASYDVLAFREPDAPRSCAGFAGGTLQLVGVRAEDHLIALDSATTTGPTRLSVSCRQVTETDVTCGTVTPGVTENQDAAFFYSCTQRILDGGEAYYRFSNPFFQDLAFGVTGVPPGYDLDVVVMDGSRPFDPLDARCLAHGNRVARVPQAAPGEYLILVDAAGGPTLVPHELRTSCGSSSLGCTGPSIACGERRSGDTTGARSDAFLYGTADQMFTGPEQVWVFNNPVRQSVNFLLLNESDPGLHLVLLPACDPTQAIDWDGSALIEPDLPAGSYLVVVDGEDGAAGTYDLVAMCGSASTLEPATIGVTMNPGECRTEGSTLLYPTVVPAADVMFSFDLSNSMVSELDQLKRNARRIYSGLNTFIPSLQFGVASFVEYPGCYDDSVCLVDSCATASNPFPFRLDRPLTTDINQVETAINSLAIAGGAKETYTHTYKEANDNPGIGWRTCARRVWIQYGDEAPVDCNVYECLGSSRNEGRDPGPNAVAGDADDILLLPQIDRMAANGTMFLPIDSSENIPEIAMWDCLARRTPGGGVLVTDQSGFLIDGSDVVRSVQTKIKDSFRNCPEVRLVPTGPYASWVTVTPAFVAPVETPYYQDYQLRICVPPGSVAGVYVIRLEAHCVGAPACTSELLATSRLDVTVVENPCPTSPVADPGPALNLCPGGTARLDGSASTACGPAGLEYRWVTGATEVCPWSATPTCDVRPSATTTYTLEVRCVDRPACIDVEDVTVTVTPAPDEEVKPVLGVRLAPTTDARFTWPALPSASSGYNVWRVSDKKEIPNAHAAGVPAPAPVCTPTATTSCSDATPVSRGTFYYQVKALCGANEGP